jgi:ferric-dicitrate binding protein FerR (iron transport regulator)
MEQERLKLLIEKYHSSKLSDNEKEELDKWFHDLSMPGSHIDEWIAEVNGEEMLANEMFSDFSSRTSRQKKSSRILYVRWAAAAVFAACLVGAGYYLLTSGNAEHPKQTAANNVQKIVPGGNKATLTLASGEKIILEEVQKGSVATQGDIAINKVADGSLVYNASGKKAAAEEISYNVLTTPVGGQYHITLSDGTAVWLNASSSIKYPSQFIGGERKVEITGEAYFEVAHNASVPFRVLAGKQLVEDIGTAFNINSYDNEPSLKTTLVEGKARVTNDAESFVLDPGQQTQLSDGQKLRLVSNVNVEEVIAWKNGLFKFNNASLPEVMRQIARWYNVKVQYEGKIENRKFNGEIARKTSLTEVLEIFSYLNYQFVIDQQQQTLTIKQHN